MLSTNDIESWCFYKHRNIKRFRGDLNALSDNLSDDLSAVEIKDLKSILSDNIDSFQKFCDTVDENIDLFYARVSKFYKNKAVGKAVAKEIYFNLAKVFEKCLI